MKPYFDTLIRYNDWANKRLFVVLPQVCDSEPRTLQLFSHVIMVERLWLDRINQRVEPLPLWNPIPLPQLIRLINASTQDWLALVAGLQESEFDRMIPYVNSQGVAYENSIRDILTQTINHSTHHRGQIVQLIRQQGMTPPLVDYIAYARQET